MSRTRRVLVAGAATAVAGLLAVSALAAPGKNHAKPKPKKPVAKAVVVNVKAFEYGYTLSGKTVPVGPVTVIVKNTGTTAHDFYVNGAGATGKTPYLAPGQTGTLKLVFKSNGSVQCYCTVPRHADQGMTGTLTVT